MSDPTARYPDHPAEPSREQPPAYVPPPGYEEYAPRQQGAQPDPRQDDRQGYQQGYRQGPPPGYGQGYRGAPPRPTSVVAVVGLVLAFVLSPVGVVVSAFGIGDTRGGRKAGRGLAVAGVVVGVLGTVLWVVAAIAAVALVRGTYATVTSVASGIPSLPSELPSGLPTDLPSGLPTDLPSGLPTDLPSGLPTGLPTDLQGVLGGEDGSADVVVDSCQAVVAGAATGQVTITNSTGAAADYVVGLAALDASGQEVGQLYAVQDDVAPGQSVQVQAYGYAGDGGEIASCVLSQASRTAR
ncbi:FxLYD domain-containing protein [Quadrisphaera sp. KR29]|uniref:FxLYD domain-containing protein n=1 Tax=Quadrisphaera sp. KR29 TaxID=3461391 RepID=UPI004044A5D7